MWSISGNLTKSGAACKVFFSAAPKNMPISPPVPLALGPVLALSGPSWRQHFTDSGTFQNKEFRPGKTTQSRPKGMHPFGPKPKETIQGGQKTLPVSEPTFSKSPDYRILWILLLFKKDKSKL
jgi:hypothetical protein